MTALLALTVGFGAVACGVMAGVYFAFSAFIMKSLDAISPAAAVSAMQSINRVIVTSTFMPVFFFTTLLCLGLAGYGFIYRSEPFAWALIAGGLVYVVGMFGVTVLFNIPLNDVLQAIPPTDPSSVTAWQHYVDVWTRWNHVRTAASLLASALFALSMRL